MTEKPSDAKSRDSLLATRQLETGLDDESYLIYSNVIQTDHFRLSSALCIADQTTYGNVIPGSTLEDVRKTVMSLKSKIIDADLVENYVQVNHRSGTLENRFALPQSPKIVKPGSDMKGSACEVNVRFSRVGFSEVKDKALLYFETYSGPKTSAGTFMTFSKENANWVLRERFQIWAS